MSAAASIETFDCVVVGGGPAGATAAHDLAERGIDVLLLDRDGRVKPCGGAVPPRLIADFAIPDRLLTARVTAARIVSPTARAVEMRIDDGFVGMVDRAEFDPWLRQRAAAAGATLRQAEVAAIERAADGSALVRYGEPGARRADATALVRARTLIGADGARSLVARTAMPHREDVPHVAAYHEIVESPRDSSFDGARCDVVYRGSVSPDFYGWVFPHGPTTSVGVGSAVRGFSLRRAVRELREATHLQDAAEVRSEGAPIPLRPRRRWDNGRDTVLAGDAAGVVAPASGEGIYYAMVSGRLAAQAIARLLEDGDSRALGRVRAAFMAEHGRVFRVLGLMQRYWYASDGRRERFVSLCRDRDVQRLTWQAYLNKRLVRARPAVHARIVLKNLAHLTGMARL